MVEHIESESAARAPSRFRQVVRDRIRVNSVLIVLGFAAVLLFDSQSAASWPIYLLAFGMLASFRQWNDVFRVPMVWAIGALIGWLVLSGLWSTPFQVGDFVAMLIRGLVMFLFVVAFAECQLRGHMLPWLGRALTVAGLISVLAALWLYYSQPPADGRLGGLGQINNQVIAGLVYGVVLIFMLDVAVTDRRFLWRCVAGAGAGMMACAVYLSESRNAWLSVALGVGVFGLAHLVRNRRRFVGAAAALAVALVALTAALMANEAARNVILPRGDSYRAEIWQAAVDRILAGNVWIGLGINTSDDVVIHGTTFLHSHDMYLSVVHQGGLIGLALLIVLVVLVLRSLVRSFDSLDAKLALGVLAIGLSSYVLDGHELVDKVGSTWFLFWLPVAGALGSAWVPATGSGREVT